MPTRTSAPAAAAAASHQTSALERACQRLRQAVGQGQLVAGQRLIEADLGLQLQASRSTVREALRRLESEGLVQARQRGLQVRRLSRQDVADLYELRELLEGLAARRAAVQLAGSAGASTGTATGTAVTAQLKAQASLWKAATRSSSTGQAGGAFSEHNRAFHALVQETAGNRHLPRMLDQTLMLLFASQFRAWVAPSAVAQAAREHLLVIQALQDFDGQAAEQHMRAHVRASAATILALPPQAFGEAGD